MNRNLAFSAAYLGMLIFGICMITLGSVMPFLSEDLHLDELAKGSLASVLPLGILAGSLVFGPVVDRYSYRVLLSLSAAVTASGIVLIGISQQLLGLQLSFFLIGLGGGSLNGTTSALVSDLSAEGSRQKGANLSMLGVFFGIGALGIPAIFGSIHGTYDFRKVLYLIGGSMMAPALYFLWIQYPAAKRKTNKGLLTWKLLLKNKLLLLIGLVLLVQSGMESLVNNWITSYFTIHSGLETQTALFTLTLFVLIFTLTRLILKFILKRIPLAWVMGTASALIMLGSGLLLFSEGLTGTFATVICLGIGLSAGFPVLLGVIGEVFREWSGTAFSIVFAISVIGNSLINYLTGWITEIKGMEAYPYLMFGCLLIFILFLYSTINTINSSKN